MNLEKIYDEINTFWANPYICQDFPILSYFYSSVTS